MSDKDFVAGMNSDARKAPVRVAFVTRRTSPAVVVQDEERVMTYPEVFFRVAVAVMVGALGVLVPATAGWIGYMIQQSLENALRKAGNTRDVVTVLTQVEVAADDGRVYPLPPGLGTFRIQRVADYLDRRLSNAPRPIASRARASAARFKISGSSAP